MQIRKNARLQPGVLLLLLVLGGCGATSKTPYLVQQDLGLHQQVELRHVPFFPQEEYQCGPAALATVLKGLGVDVTPDAVSGEIYLPQRQGSLQIELTAAARSRGLVPYPLPPNLTALLTEIDSGNPVLVLQNLGLTWFPRWHYAVAVGYDLQHHSLTLRSGKEPRHQLSFATFERTWQRAGRWALVILPPGQISASTTPLACLEAVHALHQTGQPGPALIAYRAAGERWPRDPLVLMALGNAEYAAGNLESADTVFRELVRQYPANADAWNNLAYVLSAGACPGEAREAIDCARRLAPDDLNIRDSARELSEHPAPTATSCPPVNCPIGGTSSY